MEELDRKEEFDAYIVAASHLIEASKALMEFNGLYAISLANQAEILMNLSGVKIDGCGDNCGCSTPTFVTEISDEVKNEIDDLIADIKNEIG
jgi:hypothetical protein